MDQVEEPTPVVRGILKSARRAHDTQAQGSRAGLHGLGQDRPGCVGTWIATTKTRRHRIISCSRAVLAGVLLHMFSGVQRSTVATVRSASATNPNFSSPPNHTELGLQPRGRV